MNITFITGHLCKERHALLNELALDLGEYGAKVIVVTGYPSRRINDKVRRYYLENPIEKLSKNVIVKRVGSKKGEGKGLFIRMIKYIFLCFAIYKEAKKLKTDVFYIYSSPPFLGVVGAKLTKIAPVLYNAQDLFPDTLIKIKKLSEKNYFIKLLRIIEKKIYKENSLIVTISEDMKNTIQKLGMEFSKIKVIHNWADLKKLKYITKEENHLFEDLKIDRGKFIISYGGDIGLFQGWDMIVDVAKEVYKKNKNILFVIIGSGSYKEKMLERIQNEKIKNIEVYPLQPVNRLSEVYSLGDIELVPIEKGITKIALPSKLSVIMSVGSPVLALLDENSEMFKKINDENLGVAIEHGSKEKLLKVIEECYKKGNDLKKLGMNARQFSEKNNNRKKQTKKYFNLLKELSLKKTGRD